MVIYNRLSKLPSWGEEEKYTDFVNESIERRTTGASSEPEEKRVSLRVPLWLNEVVEQLRVSNAYVSEKH